MGHLIHYQYLLGGESKTGSIIFSGDPDIGQSVYTGGRPSQVKIIAVTAPGQAAPVAKSRRTESLRDERTTRPDDDAFRGYPSAYR